MADIRSIDELDARGKRVLVRVDLNTPVKDGKVTDDTRIRAALPTIEKLMQDGGRVILVSHVGRPAGTGFEEAYSIAPIADRLGELLGCSVARAEDVTGPSAHAVVQAMEDGDVAILENVRFDAREKKNNAVFARELADLADAYVNDAFGTAHRAHASTAGVAELLSSYAGYLMQREVGTLTSMLDDPKRPFVAVLGGSKVSDKIKVIDALLDKADVLIIGGAMCFTFLMAEGCGVGKSLVEPDWVERAHDMMAKAKRNGVRLLLPVDVIVADGYSGNIFLKAVEGAGLFLTREMKRMFTKSVKTKLAALLMKDGLRDFKKLLDSNEVGGTALVGISRPVIKAHGSSNGYAIKNAIRQAVEFSRSGIIEDIAENVEHMRLAVRPVPSDGGAGQDDKKIVKNTIDSQP